MYIEKVTEKISEQQRGLENSPAFYVGEQLKEICKSSEKIAEIVLQDLENPDMSISNAENQIKKYADSQHGSAKSFCVPPNVAENIIKKFYGVDSFDTSAPKADANYINLDDFVL